MLTYLRPHKNEEFGPFAYFCVHTGNSAYKLLSLFLGIKTRILANQLVVSVNLYKKTLSLQ